MHKRILIGLLLLVALLTGACSAGQPFLVPPPVATPSAGPTVPAAEQTSLVDARTLAVSFDPEWLQANPLTVADLEREQRLQAQAGYELRYS